MPWVVSGEACAIYAECFDCSKDLAVSCVLLSFIVNFPRADSLIVDLDIFCLTAGLVNSEDAVRIIFTGEGRDFLVVLN